MWIRLLTAISDAQTRDLLQSLLDATHLLVPLDVELKEVRSQAELVEQVRSDEDDLILLDWTLAGADTPHFVRELIGLKPQLRLIVLLPLQLRQYRQSIWEAGAFSSIPKENLEQEWLSSVLCLVYRAMERELRLASSCA